MSAGARVRFEELWDEHGRAVLRYAHRRVAEADVDDVVSEVFVVAWRRIEEVPAYALPWLLGVARGVAANARRAQQRRLALDLRLVDREEHCHRDAEPLSSPVLSSSTAEAGALRAALARLSESDREALTLIAWEELSPAEAAQALRCTRATLAVRLHRARRRLRAVLEEPASPHPASTLAPEPPAPATAQDDLARPQPAPSPAAPLSPSCPGGTR